MEIQTIINSSFEYKQQIRLPSISALFNGAHTPHYHPIKPKRKRMTETQISVLTEFFKKNPFPSTLERSKLASYLKISIRSVQIWFQNKRQSTKKF